MSFVNSLKKCDDVKILVTGATGFIGKKVVEELLSRNISVITSSTSVENARSCSWFGKTTHVICNLLSFSSNENLFEKFECPDVVIHLAWADLGKYYADTHIEIQLPAHKEFLYNLVANGATHIVGAGTCFEYGRATGELSEGTATEPCTPYGEAKVKLHQFIVGLMTEFDLEYQWLRYFYTYGEGQNPKSLMSLLDSAIARGDEIFNMSGGEQVRDFLPIEKLAEYTVAVALQKSVTGAINICSGKPITVREFIENRISGCGANIKLNLGYYPYPEYEPMAFWGDRKKMDQVVECD